MDEKWKVGAADLAVMGGVNVSKIPLGVVIEGVKTVTDYWLPEWWNWIENWYGCVNCLEYFHKPCVSCEIPPGVLGLAQLVGGGSVSVAGNARGNIPVASQEQARAVERMVGDKEVVGRVSEVNLDLDVDMKDVVDRVREIEQQHVDRNKTTERFNNHTDVG